MSENIVNGLSEVASWSMSDEYGVDTCERTLEELVTDAANEIKRLKQTLTDISHGSGMFGCNPSEDLDWAMRIATDAICD